MWTKSVLSTVTTSIVALLGGVCTTPFHVILVLCTVLRTLSARSLFTCSVFHYFITMYFVHSIVPSLNCSDDHTIALHASNNIQNLASQSPRDPQTICYWAGCQLWSSCAKCCRPASCYHMWRYHLLHSANHHCTAHPFARALER